jgi:hypothetical protein
MRYNENREERLASKKRELSEKVLSGFIKFLWFETAFSNLG